VSSDAASADLTEQFRDLDWTRIWDQADAEPHTPLQANSIALTLSQQGIISETSLSAGRAALAAGREEGALERVDGGHILAGAEHPEPEQPAGTDEQAAESHTQQSTADEELRELVERQRETIERLEARVGTLESALATFAVGPDNDGITRDEFTPAMQRQYERVQELQESVTEVNERVASLGDVEVDDSWTTEDRVTLLRRHLVAENERGSVAMDYEDVQTFFADPDDGEASISDSWAAKLVQETADGHHAFGTRESPKGRTQVKVDVDKVAPGSPYRETDSAAVSSGHNSTRGGGR